MWGRLYDVTSCLFGWGGHCPGYGKERAVRILLECILVLECKLYFKWNTESQFQIIDWRSM